MQVTGHEASPVSFSLPPHTPSEETCKYLYFPSTQVYEDNLILVFVDYFPGREPLLNQNLHLELMLHIAIHFITVHCLSLWGLFA